MKDKLYEELLAAVKEVEKILADIDLVIKSTSNRKLGEKIALELYAAQMDAAIKKSNEAFDLWMQEGRNLMKETEVLLKEKP